MLWAARRPPLRASFPPLLLLRLSSSSSCRFVSTSASLRAKPRPKTGAAGPPTYDERLSSLKSAEKKIALIGFGSMLVGYVSLKMAFSGVTPKTSDSSSNMMGSAQSDSNSTANATTTTSEGVTRPLVVAGPSGAGKSTILRMLFKDFPHRFGLSVSHTTRNPRQGEVDGREYHFTTRERMKEGIESGEFIEWAEFSGNMYGTSKLAVQDVLESGKICVLDIDMQGVRSMKKTQFNSLYIFIKPPSMEVLEKRLRARKTDTEDSLRRRLNAAHEEIKYAEGPGVFNHVVVNEILDEAYQNFKMAIKKDITDFEEPSTTTS